MKGQQEQKSAVANRMVLALKQSTNPIWYGGSQLGELLQHLQLSQERMRVVYRACRYGEDVPQQHMPEKNPPPTEAAVQQDDLLPFDSDPFAPASDSNMQRSSGAQFARALLRAWAGHLRTLPTNESLMQFLGLDGNTDAVQSLTDELIAAARRLELPQRLTESITRVENTNIRSAKLEAAHLATASRLLGDFIGWLGWNGKGEGDAESAFRSLPALADGAFPELEEPTPDYSAQYRNDWLARLKQVVEDNEAVLEITPEQNRELDEILAVLRRLEKSRHVDEFEYRTASGPATPPGPRSIAHSRLERPDAGSGTGRAQQSGGRTVSE